MQTNMTYPEKALAKSSAGIDTPFSMSARRSIDASFFMSAVYGGPCWASSEGRPYRVGNTTFGAHHASINVVAPEDESPDSMRWGWLDGRSVVLVGDNDQEQRIDQLTPLLAAAGVDEITWLASTQIIPIRVVSREVAA